MAPTFFATPAEFRMWLEEHHDTTPELWVGFYKKGSGRPSITWPEAVDEALCFGWVDSIRKGIDEISYTNRFTPRKPRSRWSARNITRAGELTALGRMQQSGLEALEQRTEEPTGAHTDEQRHDATLDEAAPRLVDPPSERSLD